MAPKGPINPEATNWSWWLFFFLMPLNQQAKKGATILVRLINPDYCEKLGLLIHERGKKNMSVTQTYKLTGAIPMCLYV